MSFFGTSQGGSQQGTNDGLAGNNVMATFQQRISECTSATATEFCTNTGISNSLAAATICSSLVVNTLCTGSADCIWGGTSCAARTSGPTPSPSDDSSFPVCKNYY